MKRLLTGALAALVSIAVSAATLNPVSLLNPAGSTAGQAILSTGPSTAPAWGTVTLSGVSGTLAIANGGTGATSASAARTNLGLGSSATVNTGTSGATVPLLSTANTWTLAQAFTVRPTFNGATPYDSANLTIANYAPLASPTFTGTVTIPNGASITKPNIVGTVAADNAAAGSVGEYVTASFSAVALTNNALTNATSISLTAGDWDVSGHAMFVGANTTALTYVVAGINTTSATLPASGLYCQQTATWPTNGATADCTAPITRINVTSPTTVYLVSQAGFNTSTLSVSGFIRARRVR